MILSWGGPCLNAKLSLVQQGHGLQTCVGSSVGCVWKEVVCEYQGSSPQVTWLTGVVHTLQEVTQPASHTHKWEPWG